MLFLVYSPLNSSSIEHNLGMADYSYYFVMKRFLPLLREFGQVEILENPATDEQVARYMASGNCIYLSFTPPNKLAAVTLCPVVPVFAWEYSTIPYEEFSCPEDNWVVALQVAGSAITHSRYALNVVKSQLGAEYSVESIPAPIWDSYQQLREVRRCSPPEGLDGLNLNCTIIDSNDYLISNTAIRPRQDAVASERRLLSIPWTGEPLHYSFANGEHDLTLIGFNDAEPWGVWSRSGYPLVLFSCAIQGPIEIGIKVAGYKQNVGKRLRLEMGSACADLLLSENLQAHVLQMNIEHPTNVLAFIGVSERAQGATDPRDIGLGLAEISIQRPSSDREETASLVIDMSRDDLVFEGLYDSEVQGRWTSAPEMSIQLPTSVAGNFRLELEVFDLLHNHERVIDICLGERRQRIKLKKRRTIYEIDFTGVASTDFICISGLETGPSGQESDPRMLGLGISKIALRRKVESSVLRKARSLYRSLLELPARHKSAEQVRTSRNVMYTAIFNPKDGRKNWEDIITGFVYAFRDDAAATLLIKITYHQLDKLFEDIFTFLMELHPFKCRLVLIHGYLTDEQYEQLLLHSHFIVNASRGEGQCLPLMEFMSAGVPAVAPDNTAMKEYVNTSNAFIVNSSPEVTFWPQDPRQVFRTLWQRIDWESLVNAFSDSARIYREEPHNYTLMSEAAAESQKQYCSMDIARSRFERFVAGVSKGTA